MKTGKNAFIVVLGLVALRILLPLPGIWFPEPVDPINPFISSGTAIKQITGVFALGALFLLVLILGNLQLKSDDVRRSQPSGDTARPAIGVAYGFGIAVVLLGGLGFAINPWGMYPSQLIPPRAENSRAVKTDLFNNLSYSPQIIVLGSSRLVAVSASHIEEKTGATAFNGAFFGGRAGDHLAFARLVFDSQPSAPPLMLIVEANGLFSAEPATDLIGAPYAWLKYLPPEDWLEWWRLRTQSLITVNYLADSLYTFRYQDLYPADAVGWEEWTFDDAGSGSRAPNPNLTELLRTKLESAEHLACYVDDQTEDLAELASLAARHGTAIVFISTPYHPEYYREVLEPSEVFRQCLGEMDKLMDYLRTINPEIYYLNFELLEQIDGLDSELGYYDHQHQTPENARRLIDAAALTLVEALQP